MHFDAGVTCLEAAGSLQSFGRGAWVCGFSRVRSWADACVNTTQAIRGARELLRVMKPQPEYVWLQRMQTDQLLGDEQRLCREICSTSGQPRGQSGRIADNLDGSGTVVVVESGAQPIIPRTTPCGGSPR